MGFPDSYVSRPIAELFKTLKEEGHERDYLRVPWFRDFPQKLRPFAGAYNGLSNGYRFQRTSEDTVELKMAPPLTTAHPTFFTSDEYGKHLIGNAFSVPVLEALLRPLRRVFDSKDYAGFSYRYVWEEEDQ